MIDQSLMEIFRDKITIDIVLIVFFVIFSLVTFIKYLQRRTNLALYLCLNYVSYSIAMIFVLFGYQEVINQNAKTELYSFYMEFMSIFSVIGSILLFLFYTEISKVTQKKKNLVLVFGLGLFLILLLNLFLHIIFRPIIYLLMLFYLGYIYLDVANTFLKVQKNVDQNQTSFMLIGVGAVIFVIFFLLKVVEGSLDLIILTIITNMLLLIAQSFFFLGFILPMFNIKKTQ
jgi:hypothetical protein